MQFINFQDIDITNVVTIIALFISLLAYLESKKLRKDQGGALLFIDMQQTNSVLYVIICNIGNSYAYDVNVDTSKNFINNFSNLKLIQPSATYQYILLNSQDVNKYPNEIIFNVSYRDRYTKKKFKTAKFKFLLTDYLRYNVRYNDTLHAYDINTPY